MTDGPHLTPTSYLVLGLVAQLQPVTSYAMKQYVGLSIGYFWSFPHSQLYAEPARLVMAGLLTEDVETSGRRRRRYSITPAGREALAAWLAEPTSQFTEIRDLAMLKLFFGGLADDVSRRALAIEQQRVHQARREEYEALQARYAGIADPWQLRTLDIGIRCESAFVAFWSELAADP